MTQSGTDNGLVRLRDRAERALTGTDIDELFNRWRAIIGPSPEQMSRLAREALEALRNARPPTAEQFQALEHAIRLLRPAPLVRGGRVNPLTPDMNPVFPDWQLFTEAVSPFVGAVGRIDGTVTGGLERAPFGTGFLISDHHLVTNRHVIDKLTLGAGALARGQAEVRFGQEHGLSPEANPVAILSVHTLHKELDLAVLSIEGGPASQATIPVDPEMMINTHGMRVAVIGYPTDDGRNPAFIDPLFNGTFGVKRVSPGEVLEVRPDVFFHDCTTLGGNSGSPVLTLDGARLVGVHTDGEYLARNRALGGSKALSFLGTIVKER